MALTSIKFAPGVDKQDTAVGAIGRWVDSDNVRWRYGLPEKVGGWSSLLTDTVHGVARKQHSFVDLQWLQRKTTVEFHQLPHAILRPLPRYQT